MSKLIENQQQQITKLSESNEVLFKENYDLLKYRYLYSGSKNNLNKQSNNLEKNSDLKVLICDHNDGKSKENKEKPLIDPKYLCENDASSDYDSRFCQHSEKNYESDKDNEHYENQEN